MAATVDEIAAAKAAARATWAAGDYDLISQPLWPAGARVVQAAGVRPGDAVLDVACGTGNAAVQAALVGADVIGVDLTPELFDAARARARSAGVDVQWREGDAEELPFDDEQFDVVLSTFGCMFAPRQEVAAAELVRVLRPGGRLGVCAWTPEGVIGEFFRTVAGHLPAPPPSAASPLQWGSEDHVRSLFADAGLTVSFTRELVEFRFDSVDSEVDHYESKFGPLIKARELLEPQGRWAALHDDMVTSTQRHADPETGETRSFGEYLQVIGVKEEQ